MITAHNFGTALGPHDMRGDERSACLCTRRMAANRPNNRGDQRKRVTAIYWGSSGASSETMKPVFFPPASTIRESRRPSGATVTPLSAS
jgi:hypothetical protein